ncbi:hypothetical protein LJC56_00430 [Christensenellaceae bacterium OttesenSCG-928-K19]|nr:hypothetical protein [Christensenellaceae bacterium OttesenSCG-928-K19]
MPQVLQKQCTQRLQAVFGNGSRRKNVAAVIAADKESANAVLVNPLT